MRYELYNTGGEAGLFERQRKKMRTSALDALIFDMLIRHLGQMSSIQKHMEFSNINMKAVYAGGIYSCKPRVAEA